MPTAPPLSRMRRISREMGGQPRQFLVDVDLRGEQHQFLLQAVVVHVHHGVLQPRRELVLVGGDQLRHARRDLAHQRFHGFDALEQDLLELVAFARAHCREIVEGASEQPVAGFLQHLRTSSSSLPSMPGQRSTSFTVSGWLSGHRRFHPLRSVAAAAPAASSSSCRLDWDAGALLTATRTSTLPRLMRAVAISRMPGFERAQFVGNAELDVEIAMIDRAQFEVERAEGQLRRCDGITGHAVDHGGPGSFTR